jgi:hypothetical protein
VIRSGSTVRLWSVFAVLVLAGCTEAAATRVAERTFKIDGPGLPSKSDAPNRRVAERVCPNGYQVVDRLVRRNTPDGHRDEPGMFTNWTVRCL